MNEFKYKNLTPFKWFVLENFPFIEADFDAITNYQLYSKVIEYLNKTIDNMNEIGEQMENVTNAFIELKDYVDNYFDNLDVQDEINNKLDEMASNGQLQEILSRLFDEIENDVNNKIENLEESTNNEFQTLQALISSIDTSPAGVYPTASDLISANPDHSKIYIVTADNKWYYWNVSANTWTAGGLYQSQGVGNNEITFDNLYGTLQNYYRDSQIELGSISNTNGTNTQSTNRVRTNSKFYLHNNGQIVGLSNKKFNYSMTYYNHNDHSFVSQTGWFNNSGILSNLGGDYDIRFVFRKVDNSDFTFVDIIELSNSFFIDSIKLNKLNEKLIENISIENLDSQLKNSIIGNNNTFEYMPDFIVGNILTNGDFVGSVSNDNKTTVDYLEKTKISFTIKRGFMSKITYYNNDESFDSQSTWISATESDISVSYTIPHKAKITIANIEAVAILTNNANEMIENFVFSKDDITYKNLKNSFVHFSFDDVGRCFDKLISNYAIYNSLFDEPFFAYLKNLHDKYGAKFSLYVWDIQRLSSLGTKYKNDFISNCDWIKIGFHAFETGSLQGVTPENAKLQYETFVTAVCNFASFENIDHIPRLNYFYATLQQLNALKVAKGKIYGILTPDDDRNVDYLTSAQHDYLLDNNHIFSLENGLVFYSTNFRLDTFIQGFSSNYQYHENTFSNPYDELVYRYSNENYVNYMDNLIVFTHEWQVYNTNGTFNQTMKNYIEDTLKFANDYKLEFDYIQNRVQNITGINI